MAVAKSIPVRNWTTQSSAGPSRSKNAWHRRHGNNGKTMTIPVQTIPYQTRQQPDNENINSSNSSNSCC